MTLDRHADYSETWLLPPALEDWVPENHPARFVREFVESLDLAALGFRVRRRSMGAPSYSSDVLLKAWLFGYLRKIVSTRRLEEACRENMGLIWLLGRLEPDHNTLWRFWSDNKVAIRAVFKQSVQVAARLELVSLVLHALDSTKIQSAASRRGSLFRKDLEKWLLMADERIVELEKEISEAESREQGGYALSGEYSRMTGRRDAIRAALQELEEGETKQLQPGEPEARLMKSGARGALEFGYSSQAVMDDKSRIIVACETDNQASDVNQLNPMLEQVEENLGRSADDTVADGNYGQSEKQLAEAGQADREVTVARPAKEKETFHAANFEVDVEKRTCTCPIGQELVFCGTDWNKDRLEQRVCFRCPVIEQCPHRQECGSQRKRDGKWQRTLKAGIHRGAADRQRAKQKQASSRDALDRRGQLIEPFFGWVKQDFGLRRFTFKGLENTRTQWSMVCLTWNLMRMMKGWRRNAEAGLAAMEAIALSLGLISALLHHRTA